jgi:hypothetical protein
MDRWLQTGTLKRKLNNENETNSNIQQFLDEAASYSPPPSNVSSSSGAHSIQTECNVKNKKYKQCKEENTLIVIYQWAFLKTVMKPLHVQCVFYVMKICKIVLWRLPS